ncbi:MAG: autotransporter outer membrane beta-barrel domain-containing protein, partial [Alphaproteobacteria bacterium]
AENLGGDDTILINQSTVYGIILGDSNGINGSSYGGDDTITIENGSVIVNRISGDGFDYKANPGYDDGMSIVENVGGNDIITIDASEVQSDIAGESFFQNSHKAGIGGDDIITLQNNAVVTGSIYGEDFILSDTDTDQSLPTTEYTAGNDTVTINNSSVGGDIFTDFHDTANESIGAGDDIINVESASVTGLVHMGNGSDTFNFYDLNSTFGSTINGGDDADSVDGYIDQINLANIQDDMANFDAQGYDLQNFEYFGLIEGSVMDFGDSYETATYERFIVDSTSTATMTGAGTGDYTINAALYNDGIVDFKDDAAGDHLTVAGDLSGTGTYIFDTDFYTKKSDYITVNGNVTANGVIAINDITAVSYDDYSDTDAGKAEAANAANGSILLIEAPNDSDKSDEDFNLADANQYNNNSKQGRFTGSPYVWALANSGNDWVLTTTVPGNPEPPVVAEIPAYVSLPTIGREMAMDELGRLHTRLGELRNNQGWVGSGSSNLKTNLGQEWHNVIGFDESKANAWLKGTISHFDISSDNSFDVSGTYGGFNLGIDKKFDLGNSSPDWTLFAGLFGGYKTGDFETSGRGNQYTSNEHADIDIDAWSIGGYATFFNTAGTYIDLVAQYMDFDADIDAAGLTSSTDGYALAGSIEVGHSFDLAKNWIIEPQAQVKIAHINWDDFNDGVNDINFEDHTYVTGRAGVRVEKNIETQYGEVKPWVYAGILHEFTDAPNITYADTIFEAVDYNTAGEIKVGVTADVYKSVQMYTDLGFATDFDDYHALKGDLGVRVSW